jgi:hypothetical protein
VVYAAEYDSRDEKKLQPIRLLQSQCKGKFGNISYIEIWMAKNLLLVLVKAIFTIYESEIPLDTLLAEGKVNQTQSR